MVNLTVEQAAKTLHLSVNEVLEYATRRSLRIGTVTRKGAVLFLTAEDTHPFLADSKHAAKTSDLHPTYNEYPDPDSPYMPAPNVMLGPPVSDITIETLRIPQKEVARLKKTLGIKHRLRAMIRESFITKVVGIIGVIKGVVGLLHKLLPTF